MSQRRSALGRGLGALISNPPARNERNEKTNPGMPSPPTAGPGASAQPKPTQSSVNTEKSIPAVESADRGPQELEIKLIDANPEQPRREFDPAALEQLARSIGQHGVLQPVVVRAAGDRYELIMGERRFRASQIAGRTKIPAVVAEVDPDDRLELAIIENVQREDLNPIELALAYNALSEAGHTQDEIGRKVSKDRSSIANHIRLLDLSRTIQSDVEGGRLSMGHAKALLSLPDVEAREKLRTQILHESLSVRATERAAREITRGGQTSKKAVKTPDTAGGSLDADTRAFMERIERHLQTKVKLHPNAAGGGKIEINYFNFEDLERLGGMLLGDDQ
ncbi:MAG: ParB/RepB/Spo0J family partition protein [Myxococcota bacterium]